MRIAIIGGGHVGGALGERLAAGKHEIIYGVPDSNEEKYSALKKYARLTSPAEAAKSAEVILLATPWSAVQEAIEGLGPLTGKILIDATNPVAADFSGLAIGHTTSGGEQVAAWAKGARVVKCFNQTGFENMRNPSFKDGRAVIFAASDDESAGDLVVQLAKDIGFEGVYAGPLRLARQLEQMAWLWIHISFKTKQGRDWAFGMLKR